MSSVLYSDIGMVRPNPFRRLWEVYIPTKIVEQGQEAVDRYYQDRVQELKSMEAEYERASYGTVQ